MTELEGTHHRSGRIRRRHKRRSRQPLKINSSLLVTAVVIAILAGLLCVWLIMQPSRRPEMMEFLQQVLWLGTLGLSHRHFVH